MRMLRWIAGDISISDLLMIGSYMGGPLQRALPFRHRVLARLLRFYLSRRPAAIGHEE